MVKPLYKKYWYRFCIDFIKYHLLITVTTSLNSATFQIYLDNQYLLYILIIEGINL